ncbi:uncharacterized protein LOC100893554 [Strongylocentrotus purpuratus]|uniref:Uncharacterized protein n=1 Tax=Strongylocentrotus purpuratus TaxID=7668 RepID=A0A7M7LL51_STRPU|nr:uncharacterized protein LOC100893554 [Strongylocentrotus purpuratus]
MEKAMDSSSAKFHSIALVIAAIVVAIGVIVGAAIIARGDYGRDHPRCLTDGGRGAVKAMESSMVMNVMLVNGGRKIGMQMARYEYEENTILIETANISGFAANVAIDYDRSVVFIEIQGESLCLASALYGDMMDMADRMTNFMMDRKQQTIDIATARTKDIRYARKGAIPAGYVTTSNGPLIRGLCAGDESHWTEQTTMEGRKRRSVSGDIRICIFGFCFNISF